MNLSGHRRNAYVSACLLIAVTVVVSSFGQTNEHENMFSPVPAASRSRLIERLNSFIESHRTKQWDKQYDLLNLNEPYLRGVSKDDYVKGRIENAEEAEGLIDFRPETVAYDEAFKWWKIEGCSTWRKQGKVKAAIEAHFHDGEWYFSPIGVELIWEKVGVSAWKADSRNPVPCAGKAANNGTHPTADTTALMFQLRLGAAGDAGR